MRGEGSVGRTRLVLQRQVSAVRVRPAEEADETSEIGMTSPGVQRETPKPGVVPRGGAQSASPIASRIAWKRGRRE